MTDADVDDVIEAMYKVVIHYGINTRTAASASAS
jgi:hypothetical protein